jgi:hypothetical protein
MNNENVGVKENKITSFAGEWIELESMMLN